jgi:predicted Rossmann fold nucleotide-binding protein DprA/Smf involved in DNA uptake
MTEEDMSIDSDLLRELAEGKRTTEQLAEYLSAESDCVRGALERLREEREVYRTAAGEWALQGSGSTQRGRPRSAQTARLDDEVYALLCKSPRTSTQLCEHTGATPGRMYTSLNRLRRAGKVFLGGGRNPNRLWSARGVDTPVE